ncbi:MAG: RNA-binding S4 domain-containing protein [Bacteroidales bacterium]|jgi:ribosome-associated heat shock protein Hsp15|nr:RNA-binding S4 domain-containing protein [Bacteroidales bacterium]MBR1500345.1 RNA-binding S4 domain-containing protein [Bacteroidales bacterium]MBR1636770.1 RNA-binding S4 domain-containing protein [Bacteroidales bacterium]MBR1895125.1 RNA-binding S4 domain-containing protein [Bacteroidales bacterium]MDY6464436.1 RNA-binding S4 domain-containing protein [Bacteroidales bacterium]
MADSVRIDKYLWAIRVFKTRGDATDACKGNKVRVGGSPAKPSKEVKPGEVIEIQKGTVRYSYRVIRLLENRVGAQLVPDYAENLTPQSELDKLRAPVETFFIRRDRGSGRPTKKDRRAMEHLWDGINFDAGEDFTD